MGFMRSVEIPENFNIALEKLQTTNFSELSPCENQNFSLHMGQGVPKAINHEATFIFWIWDRLQISFLILSRFKPINELTSS